MLLRMINSNLGYVSQIIIKQKRITLGMSPEGFNSQQQQNPLSFSLIPPNETPESLAIIREEQNSPMTSSVHVISSKGSKGSKATSEESKKDLLKCICRQDEDKSRRPSAEGVESLLKAKELELRAEYDRILETELISMKERFNFILANEETRASFMLREAHRERQEKITALQSQLQCKNMAALMYVMCTERKRSKLEKLRIIRDYTNYIHQLQDILTDGQKLILHLSRGYKTAARVDHEWREKMKKVIAQFMSFIYHFAGGSPESNQYFFDLPSLLKTEAPIVDNPIEDPCEDEEEEEEERPPMEIPREKTWWEKLAYDNRPFVIFGDMAEFKPSQRREALKNVKAYKTAPKKWRNYVFNEMFFNSSCPHLADIKDMYPKRLAPPTRWECQSMSMLNKDLKTGSKVDSSTNVASRRLTGQSVDIRGNMGSLLKIITQTNAAHSAANIALLGAKDSMEITSTTKLRERASLRPPPPPVAEAEVAQGDVLAIGKRGASLFEIDAGAEEDTNKEVDEETLASIKIHENEQEEVETNAPGSLHDSLEVMQGHVPDQDHKINYERVCPMEKCQRLQVDSFIRSLPPYMRANPFTHFEMSYDAYETCSPEQLEMLQQRLAARQAAAGAGAAGAAGAAGPGSPLAEWRARSVAVQTSLAALLPPCTCRAPSPSPVSSNFVFNFEDLMPVKQALDAIHKECLFDDRIEFDRFKVVGQEDEEISTEQPKKEFKEVRYDEIRKILKKHPSLLDIFQANVQ